MAGPNVAAYLLERLRAWNVGKAFGYPGDGINGLLAAWGRGGNEPKFIQARHEEMAAFEAVGYAKFTGRVGVCAATSGPGAVHLLNGLYDAKLDHVPVVAIVGQTNRAEPVQGRRSEYVQMVTVPEQLPNVLDRAIRVALAERAPTAVIIPADVQELEYSAPEHAFKMVPSSLGADWPTAVPDDGAIGRAADVLNAGSRVAILAGQGARGARAEVEQVAEVLGAGVAKPLLGNDLLSDGLPFVTGAIGLLGTRPSYELVRDCDTLLTVESSFPYTQFLPGFGQARAVQIDIDGRYIGMRYPYEVNLVGDAAAHPARSHPAAAAQGQPLLARDHRGQRRPLVGGHGGRGDGGRRPGQPAPAVPRAVGPAARRRDRGGRLRVLGQLVRAPAEVLRERARVAVRQPGHYGAGSPVLHRREVRPPGPPGDRVRGRWGHADERPGRADHHQALLGGMARPAADRRGAAQRRPQPGHLGDARHGGRAEVHGVAGAARRTRTPPPASACRPSRWTSRTRSGTSGDRALSADRPTLLDVRTDPNVPPIPPYATFEQVKDSARAVLKGDEDRRDVVIEGVKTKEQEFLRHRDS